MPQKKALEEFGGDVPAEEKGNIDKAMEELKAALETGKAEEIDAKAEALSQAGMKLGELAYRKAQEDAAGDPDNMGEAPAADKDAEKDEDDVVDADIMDLEVEEDEDEGKK